MQRQENVGVFQKTRNIRIDGCVSCKHLCCREGVEKAPRPPKNAFAPALSSVNSPTIRQGEAKTSLPAAKKQTSIESVTTARSSDIETVDLAGRWHEDEYAKSGLRDSNRLHRLHENVTKGRFAPFIAKKESSHLFSRGDQPSVSSPSKAPVVAGSNDRPSTDYGDDFMDDLPSPSAMLRKSSPATNTPRHEGLREFGSSWQDGFPSPTALLSRPKAANEVFEDRDSLEDFNFSQFNDDRSDLEAAMVGLSDSITLEDDTTAPSFNDSTSTKSSKYPGLNPNNEGFQWPNARNISTFNIGTIRPIGNKREHEKLCLSTDSSEKPPDLPGKRTAATTFEPKNLSQFSPVPKRRRTSDKSNQALRVLSSAENEVLAAAPEIKAGQPAWVYDFDPAFVAEYQDFVEFV